MSRDITNWLVGRLPEGWSNDELAVTVDRDEIVVVVAIQAPSASEADGADGEAAAGRIARFREETRERRMRIAREAEHRFGRKVAWGVRCGDTTQLFTNLSIPVMTRLRQPERVVLDTLVDAGVARSRSHALAWCVRLVGEHSEDWLAQLRTALEEVERLRGAGPQAESA
jgi:hypothetical protein